MCVVFSVLKGCDVSEESFLLVWVFVLTLGGMVFAYTYNPYPTHLDNNPNYILVDAHMGTAWYLDRSSLSVQKYAPPQYIIAVNVVTVDRADRGNTSIDSVETLRFFYNWDLKQMYWDRTGHDGWSYLKPTGSWAQTGVRMPTGEMAFYLAYKKAFYGSREWYNEGFGSYEDIFPRSFYEKVY